MAQPSTAGFKLHTRALPSSFASVKGVTFLNPFTPSPSEKLVVSRLRSLGQGCSRLASTDSRTLWPIPLPQVRRSARLPLRIRPSLNCPDPAPALRAPPSNRTAELAELRVSGILRVNQTQTSSGTGHKSFPAFFSARGASRRVPSQRGLPMPSVPWPCRTWCRPQAHRFNRDS